MNQTQHDYRNLTGPERLIDLAFGKLLEPLKLSQVKTALAGSSPVQIDGYHGLVAENTRVALIDDDAQKWGRSFALLLFGTTRESRLMLPSEPVSSDASGLLSLAEVGNDEENAGAFLGIDLSAETETPCLIPFRFLLLDYRLHREDPNRHPDRVSGYRLLKAVRKSDPSLPVIVVTASTRSWTMTALKEEGIWLYYLKPMLEPASRHQCVDDRAFCEVRNTTHPMPDDEQSIDGDAVSLETEDFDRLKRAISLAVKTDWLRVIHWIRICCLQGDSARTEYLEELSARLEIALQLLTSEPRLTLLKEDLRHRRIAYKGALLLLAGLSENKAFKYYDSKASAAEIDRLRQIVYDLLNRAEAYPEINHSLGELQDTLESILTDKKIAGKHASWKNEEKRLLSAKAVLSDIRNAIAHDSLPFITEGHVFLLLQALCTTLVIYRTAGFELPEVHLFLSNLALGTDPSDEQFTAYASSMRSWLRSDEVRKKDHVFSTTAKRHNLYDSPQPDDVFEDLWMMAEVLLDNYGEAREVGLVIDLLLLIDQYKASTVWFEQAITRSAVECLEIARQALDRFCSDHKLAIPASVPVNI